MEIGEVICLSDCNFVELLKNMIQCLVRDIKPPILFSQIFSANFSQFEQLKKLEKTRLVVWWFDVTHKIQQ